MTKAKASTSANSARTGLGLRETRERLRLLGGELTITSSAARGTTATITLPEGADAPAAA